VLGAGGIGGYFGGRLAESGTDVTFLVREDGAKSSPSKGYRSKADRDAKLTVETVIALRDVAPIYDCGMPAYDSICIARSRSLQLTSRPDRASICSPCSRGFCAVLHGPET